jgi:hypothetical protein
MESVFVSKRLFLIYASKAANSSGYEFKHKVYLLLPSN